MDTYFAKSKLYSLLYYHDYRVGFSACYAINPVINSDNRNIFALNRRLYKPV